MAILINGSPGPIYTQAPGTVFTFTNSNNAGVTTWQWTIVDRPTGSAAILTTPTNPSATLTVDVEGTYLLALVVNGDVNTLVRAAIVFTNFIVSADSDKAPDPLRYPAATENGEVGGDTRGWTKDANRWLQFIDRDQIWPRRVAVWTDTSFQGPARATGFHTLPNGAVLPRVVQANAATLANMPVECFLDAASPAGGTAYAIINGPTKAITGLNLAGQTVGTPVYLQDVGTLGLTAGTNVQIVGYTIDTGANGRINIKIEAPTAYHGVAPGGTTHPVATTGTAGFMSATDKQKLDGIGALSGSIPPAIGGVGAVGVGAAAAHGDHTHAHGNQTDPNMHAVATPSAPGFMSAADKIALDGLMGEVAVGGTVYVRTTGDDTTGNGSIGLPFKTLQRALKIIPINIIGTAYTIDCTNLGVIQLASSLVIPAYTSNYDETNGLSVTIKSDLETVRSLVGMAGTASTPVSYSDYTIITFPTANFTVDEFVRCFLQHGSGTPMPIIHNTATEIHVVSSTGCASGSDFIITRSTTTLQAAPGFTGTTVVQMLGVLASVQWHGFNFDADIHAQFALGIDQCRRVIFDACCVKAGDTRLVGNTPQCSIQNSRVNKTLIYNGDIALDGVFISGDLTVDKTSAGAPSRCSVLLSHSFISGKVSTSVPTHLNIVRSSIAGNLATARDSDVVINGLGIDGAVVLDTTNASLTSVCNITTTPSNIDPGLVLKGCCDVVVADVNLATAAGQIKIGYLPLITWADFDDIMNPQYRNIVDYTGSRATGSRIAA